MDVVPTKVEDTGILQLVKECTERDPDRWQDEGDRVDVIFDGYVESLYWDDFGTRAEPPFRNHIYAGVCTSLEEITRGSGDLEFNHIYIQNENGQQNDFAIDWGNEGRTEKHWIGHGENRAEAALRAFVAFLRATA